MEIIVLLALYYLSQNPDFLSRIKPVMSEMKNSQELLKFITDLSKFSSVFSSGTPQASAPTTSAPSKDKENQTGENKKSAASQTSGIADDFIQQCLENYFKKHRS